MNFKNYDMKKFAKKTVEQFGLDSVNITNIKNIILSRGYTIIRYSEDLSSNETLRLIETLDIKDYAHIRNSVTYCDKTHRFVFIRNEVNEEEFLYLLALELGNILICKNPVDNVLGIEIKDSIKSNEFAHHLCDMANHGLLYNTFKYYILRGLAAILCVLSIVITFGYKFIYKPLNADFVGIDVKAISDFANTSIVEENDIPVFALQELPEITEDMPEKSDDGASDFILSENERVYYATKSGTKYHISGCSYINGKETVELSASDIENGKYTPCSRCFK